MANLKIAVAIELVGDFAELSEAIDNAKAIIDATATTPAWDDVQVELVADEITLSWEV